MRHALPPALLVVLLGCATDPSADPTAALQSATLVRAADCTETWAAHADEGAISRTEGSGDSLVLDLSGEPSHVARFADRLYVSLPARGTVAALDTRGAAPLLSFEATVGSQPAGIVTRRSDGHLFVALVGENRVVELDPGDLGEVQGWDVAGAPTGLAIHPDGEHLYVSSALGGRLTHVSLLTGVTEAADIPVDEVVMAGASSGDEPVVLGERQPRLTSAPAVTEAGDRLAVGLQRLDTATTPGSGTAYVAFDEVEGPRVETTVAWSALSASGAIVQLELVDATVEPPGESTTLFSYLNAVAWSPDGQRVAATMEASDRVVVYAVDSGQAVGSLAVTAPRGVLVDDDGLVVHADFGASLVYASITDAPAAAPGQVELVDTATFPPIPLPELDAAFVLGRRLFHTAMEPQVSLGNTATACSGCHAAPLGTDGLTWPLPDGYRQTPALSGDTVHTPPYQWDGEVESIAAEALATATDRMGGEGMTSDEAAAIATWVQSRHTLSPPTRLDPAAVRRGEELFQALGCVGCHSGQRGTDLQRHEVAGIMVDTPSLVGVAHTPPYLHAGNAADLGEVVDFAAAGRMGAAFSVTDAERADLVSYLRSW